jgi:hypothetical protein
MTQRVWIQVPNTDVAEWWLNPDYVTTIYRNVNSNNYVICMDDGSDWPIDMNSDGGKAITDMLKGKR